MKSKRELLWKSFFYFKIGFRNYFQWFTGPVNMLMIGYYVAGEKIGIQEIIPSFSIFIILAISIGVPLFIGVGHAHFKKTKAFRSEADIQQHSNPYLYRLHKRGYQREVMMPIQYKMNELMLRLMAKQGVLEEQDRKEIEELRKWWKHLIDGGAVGDPQGKKDKDSL